MPNRADLQALIERVDKATGPDRDLDAEIYMALRPYADTQAHMAAYASDPDAYWYWMASRDYTASVDAALALLERALPGWSIQLYRHPDGAFATLYRLGEVASILDGAVERYVATPYFESIRICDAHLPLAIIAATLRAMQTGE